MGIVLAIFIFGFIVFFHELGHFILARKNGIDVDEFWIGMGPTLLHKKIGNTDYCLKLLPIGGACMMGEDEVDDLSEGSFNSKSPWRRISVIAAGPVFNFILAFICSIIFIGIVGVDKPIIGSVTEGSQAYEAGIEAGDKIVKIGGKHIFIFRDIFVYEQIHAGEEQEIVYLRDGEKHSVVLTPEKTEDGYYIIGITSTGYEKAGIVDMLKYSVFEVRYWIDSTISGLRMLFTGKVGVSELSGPVGVVSIVDNTYKQTKSGGALLVFANMMRLAILLSANLGVMNLLPIPALDGGRLAFLIVEIIRGKRIPPEKEGYVHLTGMVFLLGLMAFVMFNDVRKIFF